MICHKSPSKIDQTSNAAQVRRPELNSNDNVRLAATAHHFGRFPVFNTATLMVQPKLKINLPGDKYEREADNMAAQVMTMTTPVVQRKRAKCKGEEKKQVLQTKSNTSSSATTSTMLTSQIEQSKGGGQSLDNTTRSFMESRFGADFSNVRIHTDNNSQSMNREMNARAFTLGNDIYFNQGQYNPGVDIGKKLLAHELTHVMQQGGGDSLHRNGMALAQQHSFLPNIDRMPVSGLVQRQDHVTREELGLVEQRADYHRLVTNWYTNYMFNLETNARNAREANQRIIEFEEGSIGQLRTTGAVGSGAAYLFGTPGAVVALCVIVLTEVAAQGLSSRSAKIAAAAARLDSQLTAAHSEVTRRKELIDNRIDATDTLDWGVWLRIASEIDRAGVPQIVPENIIYRDLLLAFARGGGYNISGSQWNVENMSPFGESAWYHSWDWGSPGWTNGRDIAEELNALAEGDPSTRKRVSVNPP